jgi:hypothetical protein
MSRQISREIKLIPIVPDLNAIAKKKAELSDSVLKTKQQLTTIKEVESKVQNRVKYLSKEEEKMLGKIAVM